MAGDRGYATIEDAYPRLHTSRSGVDWRGVSPVLLNFLEAMATQTGKQVTIFSGRRTQADVNRGVGFAGDPHTKGIAVDANVDGVPIGHAIDHRIFARYGIRTGDQPNFYRGAPDPSHVDLAPPQGGDTAAMWGTPLVSEEIKRARAHHVDPIAALAVESTEGSFQGAVGDLADPRGPSFGPSQLLREGALGGRPGLWAQTPAGVESAAAGMARVARGKVGEDAIRAIVTGFERPANPAPEISRAIQRYHEAVDSGAALDPTHWAPLGGGAGTGSSGTAGGASPTPGTTPVSLPIVGGAAKLAEKAIWPFTHPLRFAQIIGGGILVMVGVILLARSVGVRVPTGPLGAIPGVSS